VSEGEGHHEKVWMGNKLCLTMLANKGDPIFSPFFKISIFFIAL
jgi:hypothetical protein